MSLTDFKTIRKELKPGAVPSVFWWKTGHSDPGRAARQKSRLVTKDFEDEVAKRMKRDWAEEQVR